MFWIKRITGVAIVACLVAAVAVSPWFLVGAGLALVLHVSDEAEILPGVRMEEIQTDELERAQPEKNELQADFDALIEDIRELRQENKELKRQYEELRQRPINFVNYGIVINNAPMNVGDKNINMGHNNTTQGGLSANTGSKRGLWPS